MKPKSRFVFTFVRKSMILICLLLTLPVASLLADNLVYERVTSLSQLSQGMQLIICDRENARALSKDFLTDIDVNTVDVERDGDCFIGNDKVATFVYYTTTGYQNLRFVEVPAEKHNRSIEYISHNGGSAFDVGSKSNAKLTISFKSNGEAKIKIYGKNYVLNRKSYGKVMFFDNKSGDAAYVDIYRVASSKNPALELSQNNSWTDNVKNKDAEGKFVTKVSLDRTFTADGGWYTVCLPFALSSDDITNCFKNAVFQEFQGVKETDGVVSLQFGRVYRTEAGKPYLVKPVKDLTASDMQFSYKVISVSEPISVSHSVGGDKTKAYSFEGTFGPMKSSDFGKDIMFVGGGDGRSLVSPNGEGTMKGFRAYFALPEDAAASKKKFKIVDDDAATSVTRVNGDKERVMPKIFTVTGQQVSSGEIHQAPGIYIKGGKKILMK